MWAVTVHQLFSVFTACLNHTGNFEKNYGCLGFSSRGSYLIALGSSVGVRISDLPSAAKEKPTSPERVNSLSWDLLSSPSSTSLGSNPTLRL